MAPAPTTNYVMNGGQVILSPKANERKGIQPTVNATINNKKRADVPIGAVVNFSAEVEVPKNMGRIIDIEWDFDGSGQFKEKVNLSKVRKGPSGVMYLSATNRFSRAGTYFVTIRVASQRNGDMKTDFTRIQNLDRVRVVVNGHQ